MSEKAKQLVRKRLSRMASEAEEKSLLTIRQKEEGQESPPPKPENFPSRSDYRKALIEHVGSKAKTAVNSSLEKLEKIGLSVTVGPLTSSIIIKGNKDQLTEALDIDEVEAASFDEEMNLIEPEEDDQ